MITINLADAAYRRGEQLLRRALPAETGGILVGWRTSTTIEVTDMLPVPAHTSSGHHYERNHDAAQAVLGHHLRQLTGDNAALVGYVGEWHSHPATIGPSHTDQRTMANLARATTKPTALVVLAHNPADDTVRTYCLTAQPPEGHPRRRRQPTTRRRPRRTA